jgi:hypothetical protein
VRNVQTALSFFYRNEEQFDMSTALTAVSGTAVEDRIRRATAPEVNRHIDRQTEANILHYANAMPEVIDERLEELDREWDVERLLEFKGTTIALAGLVLGLTVNKKWLIVPAVILPLMLNFLVRGWAPPLPVLRHLGMRTLGEINRERNALLASKGNAAAGG